MTNLWLLEENKTYIKGFTLIVIALEFQQSRTSVSLGQFWMTYLLLNPFKSLLKSFSLLLWYTGKDSNMPCLVRFWEFFPIPTCFEKDNFPISTKVVIILIL